MLTRRELRERERSAQRDVPAVPQAPAGLLQASAERYRPEAVEDTSEPRVDSDEAAAYTSELREAEARVAAVRSRESAVAAAATRSQRRRSSASVTTSPEAKPVRRGRRAGALVAMSFVAAIAVATSMPAISLLSPEQVQAQQLAALTSAGHQDGGAAQSFVAGSSRADIATRDNFGAEEKKTQTNVSAIARTSSSSFTNNPNGTIQWPFAVGVPVSDHFGYRNCAGCSTNHGGTDFNPGDGSPIQVIADGVVSYVEDGEGSLGVHVIIDHQVDGRLVSSVYAHMQHGSAAVKVGDPVKVGQLVGLVGTTGMSTGPHLHFEIRLDGITKVDSFLWLQEHAN